MKETPKIQLQTEAILNVPFNIYDDDFLFIVNGEKFKTKRIISHLLSPIISQNHLSDPTIDVFNINTQNKGDFLNILNLVNFTPISIPIYEIKFIDEVIHILGNNSIFISNFDLPTINETNIFNILMNHNFLSNHFQAYFSEAIEFISFNFHKFCESEFEYFQKINTEIIDQIISFKSLRLKSEDQLLNFINNLYENSDENDRFNYSILYHHVLFSNVSINSIQNFLSIFNINDINIEIWRSISKRLLLENIKLTKEIITSPRYEQNYKLFSPIGNSFFSGIIKYFRDQTNGNISQKVEITASSYYLKDKEKYSVYNITKFDDPNHYFHSDDVYDDNRRDDNWVCIHFRENKILPTDYQIRTYPFGKPRYSHLKTWIIEGSNDEKNWEILDSQNDCGYLNGLNFMHSFQLANKSHNFYQYIRIRLTGKNWDDKNYLVLDSFEIYGILI